jgi:hypothetical protein
VGTIITFQAWLTGLPLSQWHACKSFWLSSNWSVLFLVILIDTGESYNAYKGQAVNAETGTVECGLDHRLSSGDVSGDYFHRSQRTQRMSRLVAGRLVTCKIDGAWFSNCGVLCSR